VLGPDELEVDWVVAAEAASAVAVKLAAILVVARTASATPFFATPRALSRDIALPFTAAAARMTRPAVPDVNAEKMLVVCIRCPS
jgi:hypothetical protein